MQETDDSSRYIEYLQNELSTPGWDALFDSNAWADWCGNNRPRLAALAFLRAGGQEDVIARIERLNRDFQRSTKFELPHSTAIFQPLLNQVVQTSERVGLKPVREVRIATSTDVSATPLTRPTSGTHLLFIGLGTASFCNYWAKAFTAVIKTIKFLRSS